ncbi:site-2 protease family protein [Novosphingobium sp.]|uniref:site-2 protease family protein n=1 Tax=Novosphingobium sp. TaxID=1874826 RepID=UPI0035B4D6BE
MANPFYDALALLIPLVLAIVFHEVAHGWTARALGDPTAAEMNRLSLNPFRHVDPVGTVILPGFLALVKAPVFGWAKPVPVNQWRLRNPRFGMMLVAAAGPGMNLLMALVSVVLLGLLLQPYADAEPVGLARFAMDNLVNFLKINVFLALFNLLPIPPFDGSHILEGLLPDGAARAYASLRQYGFLLVIGLIVVLPSLIPGFDPVGAIIDKPFAWVMEQYLAVLKSLVGA